MLQISHGYSPLRSGDPLIAQAEQTLSEIGEAFEFGKWWVEFFPWRAYFLHVSVARCSLNIGTLAPPVRYIPDWVPGTGWKHRANGIKKDVLDMVYVPHNMVKEQLVRVLKLDRVSALIPAS
jgi:hypothetical protein